jgi:hypothetical protein
MVVADVMAIAACLLALFAYRQMRLSDAVIDELFFDEIIIWAEEVRDWSLDEGDINDLATLSNMAAAAYFVLSKHIETLDGLVRRGGVLSTRTAKLKRTNLTLAERIKTLQYVVNNQRTALSDTLKYVREQSSDTIPALLSEFMRKSAVLKVVMGDQARALIYEIGQLRQTS